MTRKYLFADEAGDFNFSSAPNVSKYFILCTVALTDCQHGAKLLDLRRDMIWRDIEALEFFHATKDKQAVRDEVYTFLGNVDFRADVTILEKAKAQPQTRTDDATFYKYAWYYHLKHVAPHVMRDATELMLTTASIGTKKGQAIFTAAVNDVAQQTLQLPRAQWKTTFTQSMADPCLQIADYVTWAVQRKWERGDARSYDLISAKLSTEYDLWRRGTTRYY